MRSFSFIHAAEDVPDVLAIAAEAGLIIRDGEPTCELGPIILGKAAISRRDSGQFVAYRDEWIFGELSTTLITAGAYAGKYDISPGVNGVGVEFYFMGERHLEGCHRLGNGTISRRADWYSPKDHGIYPSPPEVNSVFDEICKRVRTGKRVRAGGRTYHLLSGSLRKIARGYLPPFDFIEWPIGLV